MKYPFDNFVLDADAYQLLRGGERRHVEPQVLEILWYLAAHRDRVVTRDELLDGVWSKTFDWAAFDLVGIQDDIALSVAETLQGENRADPLETQLSGAQGTDPETYRLHL